MPTTAVKNLKRTGEPVLVVIDKSRLVRSTATQIRRALKMKKPSSYKIHKMLAERW